MDSIFIGQQREEVKQGYQLFQVTGNLREKVCEMIISELKLSEETKVRLRIEPITYKILDK